MNIRKLVDELKAHLEQVSDYNCGPAWITRRAELLDARPEQREHLPPTREGITHHFRIATGRAAPDDWVNGYVTVGLYDQDVYDDSEPPPGMASSLPLGRETRVGEVFVKLGKAGDALAAIDQWAIAVSVALQMGADPVKLLRKFVGARFEPMGLTSNPEIRQCASPIDYVARWLLARFYPEPRGVEGTP